MPAGALVVGIDPLTAFFLAPLLLLAALAAIYGRAYLCAYADRKLARPPALSSSTCSSPAWSSCWSRATRVLFLVAWEVMTLSSYLLVTFEHEDASVRRAGWVYLIAAHVGVALSALACFCSSGAPRAAWRSPGLAQAAAAPALVLLLALVGFGIKAGIVPLHVWLPEAHAAAPSHVSALMSGVLIKLGLYGILRVADASCRPRRGGPARRSIALGARRRAGRHLASRSTSAI